MVRPSHRKIRARLAGSFVLIALIAINGGGHRAFAQDDESARPRELSHTQTPSDPKVTTPDALGVNAEAPGRMSVLVYMDPKLGRGATERAAVKAFAPRHGAFVKYEYKNTMPHVLNIRNLPTPAVEALRRMSGVVRVEEDQFHENVLRLHDGVPLVRGLQSQIAQAGLSADGSGVRICVVDTGIDSDHIMYADRIDAAAGYDFHNNDPDPEDDHGHGSHVAGIAGGGTGLVVDFGCPGPAPFQGIAPEATLIGVKVLNWFGGGLDSNIIAGIDHCADSSPSGGRADVINLSIGTGQFSGNCDHPWAVAANNAAAAGVVTVAAAGNENYANALSSPACGAAVIAVGATYEDSYPNCQSSASSFNWGSCVDVNPAVDDVACFSNQSGHLDVVAPGCEIWSASNDPGGTWITGTCGTSMSSPMVAGLAALVLDLDSSLSPAEVRQRIRDGAIDMGPVGFDTAYGYGRIDVVRTLTAATGCASNADCDDGLFCTGTETCVSGLCQSSGNPCGGGAACNEATQSCDVPACNNDGMCEAGEDCVNCPNDCRQKTNGNPNSRYCCGGDLPDCGDLRCSESGWSCGDTEIVDCTIDQECDDGLFCNGAEMCSNGSCQGGSDPCPGMGCNESGSQCVTCAGNKEVCSINGDCCSGNCRGGVCRGN